MWLIPRDSPRPPLFAANSRTEERIVFFKAGDFRSCPITSAPNKRLVLYRYFVFCPNFFQILFWMSSEWLRVDMFYGSISVNLVNRDTLASYKAFVELLKRYIHLNFYSHVIFLSISLWASVWRSYLSSLIARFSFSPPAWKFHSQGSNLGWHSKEGSLDSCGVKTN